jgi:hypothetical protein
MLLFDIGLENCGADIEEDDIGPRMERADNG